MEEVPKDTRKTISFTHRQAGIGLAGIVSAVLALGPVKQFFFTREEGLAQSKEIDALKLSQDRQFAELKLFISQGQDEQIRKLERSNDKLVDRIKDSENRSAKAEERLDRRIDTVEGYLKLHSNRSNN